MEHDELMQSYLDGELSAEAAEHLAHWLRADPANARFFIREVHTHRALRDEFRAAAEQRDATAEAGVRRASRKGLRRLRPSNAGIGWWPRYAAAYVAVAAALLVTVGLIALRPNPNREQRPLTRNEQRRHQIIIEQLHELKLERAAVETQDPVQTTKTAPDTTPTDEATRLALQREAEEATRYIEARQRFMMQQLRVFQNRRPLLDDLDVGEFETQDPASNGTLAVVETGPVEVGQVFLTEGEDAGVLIREAGSDQDGRGPEAAKESDRLALTKGLALLSGDRIETARGMTAPRASVRLKGGATLDLDGNTSLEVLGRDSLRLNGGRLYAHIAVPVPEDSDPESAPPFSLQTEAGRLLTHDLQAEIFLSPSNVPQKRLEARVDGGKVHIVNGKGHAVGRKGQELRALKDSQPTQHEGFAKPIWRGRNCTNPGLPIGKGNPVLLSHGCPGRGFNMEYALALAHTGEIDLRGILITRSGPGDHTRFLGNEWLTAKKEIDRLRTTGLRFAPDPVMGAPRCLQPPASGRYQDVVPERSPAATQLVTEASRASPERPLVVVTSGTLTDLASAWLIDNRVAERVVVVTEAYPNMQNNDPWAFKIVLAEYRCVSVHAHVPVNMFPVADLNGKRWAFIAKRNQGPIKDFSRFACVTVAGFACEVERARFIAEPQQDTGYFSFQPDPDGKTWLIKRVDDNLLIQEFKSTFVTGPTAK